MSIHPADAMGFQKWIKLTKAEQAVLVPAMVGELFKEAFVWGWCGQGFVPIGGDEGISVSVYPTAGGLDGMRVSVWGKVSGDGVYWFGEKRLVPERSLRRVLDRRPEIAPWVVELIQYACLFGAMDKGTNWIPIENVKLSSFRVSRPKNLR